MRWYRSIKIIVGFVSGTLIASLLHLAFPISAGIITILNLMDTKKASVNVSIRRLISAIFGLGLLYLIFELIGYGLIGMFIFVLIFTPLAFKFKAKEGLIVNIVLGSHLLVYHQVSTEHFLNELFIVLIGVGIGLLLSFHVPQKEQKIKILILEIDEDIRQNLYGISLSINNLCMIDEDDFNIDRLIEKIKYAKSIALEQMGNYYSVDYSYYYEFFQLRLNQIHRIKYMKERLNLVFVNQSQAKLLSDFTSKLSLVFNPDNDGSLLIDELDSLKVTFDNLPLPNTREDFIEQSALMQFIHDLEEFIQMKIRYSNRNKTKLI